MTRLKFWTQDVRTQLTWEDFKAGKYEMEEEDNQQGVDGLNYSDKSTPLVALKSQFGGLIAYK